MAGVYLIAVFVLNELRRVGCFVVFLGVFFFLLPAAECHKTQRQRIKGTNFKWKHGSFVKLLVIHVAQIILTSSFPEQLT